MSAAWVGRVVGQAIDWSLLRLFAAVGEMAERTQPPRYRDEADALNALESQIDSWGPDELWSAQQRSAAVSTPAADNTTDCGCGSGTKCPDPITCPDAVTAAMTEDTTAADGTDLYDAIVALWDYHKIHYCGPKPPVWGCEGCAWIGLTPRDHLLHRLALVADMKNATHRIQEQLGGAS